MSFTEGTDEFPELPFEPDLLLLEQAGAAPTARAPDRRDRDCGLSMRDSLQRGGAGLGRAVLCDRTEMSGLLRELAGARSVSYALPAQQHEFLNRLHAVTGLFELGQVDEAIGYLTELRGGVAEFAQSLRARIGSPLIIGLLLGKAAEASERRLTVEISEDTWLGESPQKPQALRTSSAT
jgi:sensor histidine kinase regulating citrate/malate metabolism